MRPSRSLEGELEAARRWLPGLGLERREEVDSTNSELMRRARAGALAPTVLVARCQTAGRGRLGRSWSSQPGASLTFSLGTMLAPTDWSGLSLAIGVALAEALDEAVRVKWPNDLWVEDRKLAGILVETAGSDLREKTRAVVVGVGLNVAPSASGGDPAAACLQELEGDATPDDALLCMLEPLARALRQFDRHGFAPFAARFAARDALSGRSVAVQEQDRVALEGSACGVDGAGALLVHTSSGMKAVTTHEVRVRPVPLPD